MPVKILATADLHLGRKSSAIPQDVAESSVKYTWNRFIDLAIHRQVDIVLLGGDIIDRDNRYFEAIGPLQNGFAKLKNEGIQVYVVAGNHDYDVIHSILANREYENVHFLGEQGTWEKQIFSKNNLEIQFAGWSFPSQHFKHNPLNTFERLELDSHKLTIGLLHTEVDMKETNYAPVTTDELATKPVDAWILGHIHKPTDFDKQNSMIGYPGSPHALNPGENGIHGPLFIQAQGKNNITIERIPLSPVRYETINVAIKAGSDETGVREAVTTAIFEHSNALDIENVSWVVYDVELEGEHSSVKDIDRWILQAREDFESETNTGAKVVLRKVVNNVQPAVDNLEELAKHPSPPGKLAETILAINKGETTPFLDKLVEEWKEKQRKLNNAGVYAPLTFKEGGIPGFDKEMALGYIKKECNKLLSVLIQQKEQ
ncbi:MAG: metallophosphoesterase family protein [Bacteroidota bacterium]